MDSSYARGKLDRDPFRLVGGQLATGLGNESENVGPSTNVHIQLVRYPDLEIVVDPGNNVPRNFFDC